MSLIAGITLPPGIEIIYNKTIKMYDLSIHCNVGKNPRNFPRARKFTLREISYLFNIAYSWAQFTQDQKDEWMYAANILGWHGYNLFVQDTSYRKKNGIGGLATPELYHQYFVGHIGIDAPSNSAEIRYSNRHRFYPPGTLALCYHSNLVSAGGSPLCQLLLDIHRYYLGGDHVDTYAIDIPLVSTWDKQVIHIPQVIGFEGRFEMRLVLTDVTGDFWFDNVTIQFNGTDQNPDPFCDDVPNNWEIVDQTAGVTIESVYPLGSAL